MSKKLNERSEEELSTMSAAAAGKQFTEDTYTQVIAKVHELTGMRVADLRKAFGVKDIKDFYRCLMVVALKEYK